MIGAGRCVGTTHLAVWMANYLAGVRRERVAVLEWNDHKDFERIRMFCGGAVCRTQTYLKDAESGRRFRILEVDYFEEADAKTMAFCLNEQYQHIIADYGENTEAAYAECARCDKRIIVGSLSEWQADTFLELTGRAGKDNRSWSYTAAFGSEEARKEWEKAFHQICLRIPASEDAFSVRRTDMEFFEKLLR